MEASPVKRAASGHLEILFNSSARMSPASCHASGWSVPTKLWSSSVRAPVKSSPMCMGVWGRLTAVPKRHLPCVFSRPSRLPECLASFPGSFEATPMMFSKSFHMSWAVFKVPMGDSLRTGTKAGFPLLPGHFSFVHFPIIWGNGQSQVSFGTCSGHLWFWRDQLLSPCLQEKAASLSSGGTTLLPPPRHSLDRTVN